MIDRQFHLTQDITNYLEYHRLDYSIFLDMLVHSARVTHEKGNRRYHDYIFDIQGNEVFNVFNITTQTTSDVGCTTCMDTKRVPVFDECQHCQGVGCHHCDEGLSRNFIVCPTCTSKLKTVIR